MGNFYNINYLGHIPFNPDALLEKGKFNNRPIGMKYTDLIHAYWTIRSFKVDLTIETIVATDPLSAFIAGGGISAGIVGALGGLARAEIEFFRKPGIVKMNGYTKIQNKYRRYVRKQKTSSIPFEGIQNGELSAIDENSSQLEIDTEIKPNPIYGLNNKPVEADLCVPGPIHKLVMNGASLTIDFSDIYFYKRLYWPKIVFMANVAESSFSSNILTLNGQDLPVNGYFNFMGYNIPLYGAIAAADFRFLTPFAIAEGKIVAGDRCCDRFFYDGFDSQREKECANTCVGQNGPYKETKVTV